LPSSASDNEKDKLISDQAKTIRELEIAIRGYEDNLGEPLRAVREDVEKEWVGKVEVEVKKRQESEQWAAEVVKQLEKEKQARLKLEEERRALAAFVSKFDSLGLGLTLPSSKLQLPKPTPGGAMTAYAERRQSRSFSSSLAGGLLNSTTRSNSTTPLNTPYKGHNANTTATTATTNLLEDTSPIRPTQFKSQPRLLDQVMPEEADMSFDEFEVEQQLLNTSVWVPSVETNGNGKMVMGGGKMVTANVNARDVFGDKENILPVQA